MASKNIFRRRAAMRGNHLSIMLMVRALVWVISGSLRAMPHEYPPYLSRPFPSSDRGRGVARGCRGELTRPIHAREKFYKRATFPASCRRCKCLDNCKRSTTCSHRLSITSIQPPTWNAVSRNIVPDMHTRKKDWVTIWKSWQVWKFPHWKKREPWNAK